jgi:hypothetical protein
LRTGRTNPRGDCTPHGLGIGELRDQKTEKLGANLPVVSPPSPAGGKLGKPRVGANGPLINPASPDGGSS